MDEFSKLNGQSNIQSTKWNNNIKSMKCITPLVGMPFCNQTRVENSWKILDRSDVTLVI